MRNIKLKPLYINGFIIKSIQLLAITLIIYRSRTPPCFLSSGVLCGDREKILVGSLRTTVNFLNIWSRSQKMKLCIVDDILQSSLLNEGL
ncbi:Glutathione S-transferase hmp2 [Fusarium oxysporum f. sp. albedinis]|nr:Glutathione S-transferase hmp2 [Fusarium oxysporum f. sp. albedinis]